MTGGGHRGGKTAVQHRIRGQFPSPQCLIRQAIPIAPVFLSMTEGKRVDRSPAEVVRDIETRRAIIRLRVVRAFCAKAKVPPLPIPSTLKYPPGLSDIERDQV